jgi:tetratricopeptide (TPR) repeat protein
MARKIIRSATAAAVALVGVVSLAGAQAQRGPNPNAPRLMVSACRTADKALATQCADKLRSQVEGDVSYRTLYVLPKADVENTLSASGYDPAVALAPGDAGALAKQIRADMYIDATIEKAGAGYKLTAAVVPQRDANLVQPLGTWENAKIDGLMNSASKAFQDVFNKTYDRQKSCASLVRERKYADAQKEIDGGLKEFATSTWMRYCKMQILKDQKAGNEEFIKVAQEIVNVDPMSKGALQELVVRYDAMGNKEKKIEALMALQKADPGNAKLNTDIANEFAAMGDFTKARPVVEKAVAENPGDVNLVRTYWLILTAVKEYKKAMEVGDQMMMLDTATADSAYFSKSFGLAMSAGDSAKAVEYLRKGGAKFPKIVEFPRNESGLLRRMGKNPESIAAAKRALKINPKEPNLRAVIAQAYIGANQTDSAVAIAKEMLANGEDKGTVAGVAVAAGDALRKVPDQLKASGADAATIQAAWERAYAELAWADTLAKGTSVSPQAKFLMGVAALSVGQGYLSTAGDPVKKVTDEIKATKPMPDAAKQKAMLDKVYPEACANTNKANDYFVVAQLALPAGASFAADATRQVMGSLMQLNGYVEQMTKAYCKK